MWALFLIILPECVMFSSCATTARDVVAELELDLAIDVFGSVGEADCRASAM
jgi:hypothetical protein